MDCAEHKHLDEEVIFSGRGVEQVSGIITVGDSERGKEGCMQLP